MNQFENEQEFDRDDLSATELTAGSDNLLDDDLEGEDTGSIDTDYATENLNTEDDELLSEDDDLEGEDTGSIDTDYATENLDTDDDDFLDDDDELSDADVGGANADLGGTESSTGDNLDDDSDYRS